MHVPARGSSIAVNVSILRRPGQNFICDIVDLISLGADNSLMLTSKGNEMTEFERDAFGMTKTAIREQYMNSVTAHISGLEMVVMSILSDAQEMISLNNPTIASPNSNAYVRKQMNIAKFILSEMLEARQPA